MHCVCDPLEMGGYKYIQAIGTYFGICAYSPRDVIGFVCGLINIGFWLFAQVPQLIANYRSKSGESLSVPFLVIWLLGDVSNFLGCFFTNQSKVQLYTSIYFLFMDILLLLQLGYYEWFYKGPRPPKVDDDDEEGEQKTDSTHKTPDTALKRSVNSKSDLVSHGDIKKATPVQDDNNAVMASQSPKSHTIDLDIHYDDIIDPDVHKTEVTVLPQKKNQKKKSNKNQIIIDSSTANHDMIFENTPSISTSPSSQQALHNGPTSSQTPTPRHSTDNTTTPIDTTTSIYPNIPSTSSPLPKQQGSAGSSASNGMGLSMYIFVAICVLCMAHLDIVESIRDHLYHSSTSTSYGSIIRSNHHLSSLSTQYTHYNTTTTTITMDNSLYTDSPILSSLHTIAATEDDDKAPICNATSDGSDAQLYIGIVSAWLCGILYLTARIPQITHNYKRKSTKGLTLSLFMMSFMANCFYAVAILLPNTTNFNMPFYRDTFPYLIGSIGANIFSAGVIFQVWYYQPKRVHERKKRLQLLQQQQQGGNNNNNNNDDDTPHTPLCSNNNNNNNHEDDHYQSKGNTIQLQLDTNNNIHDIVTIDPHSSINTPLDTTTATTTTATPGGTTNYMTF